MTSPRRELEPIDTCPEALRPLITGVCAVCGRHVAPVRRLRRYPDLRRWCLSSANPELCKTCQPRPGRGDRAPTLPADVLRMLRRAVGACTECGWYPGMADGVHSCTPKSRVLVSNTNHSYRGIDKISRKQVA